MKKQTKHFPFLAIQQQRFELSYLNHSQANHLPSEKQCHQWLWHAIKNHHRRAQISLVFFDETEARQYNRDYRNKDYATNILSFAENESIPPFLEKGAVLRGDLIICPPVVEQEAQQQNKTLNDHYAHLIIHGALHLMGYDHIEEADAEQMEKLEIQLLTQIGIANPYE